MKKGRFATEIGRKAGGFVSCASVERLREAVIEAT
jgi:hypothetical protein